MAVIQNRSGERIRTAESMAADLVRRIETGEWPEGFRLPPERELAATYSLARNTVRKALSLVGDRVVRSVGRGTHVRSQHGIGMPNFAGHLRSSSPAEVMEVRLIIEPQAAALAAQRATSEDLDHIDDCLRQSLRAKGLAEFEHWDAALHLAIFRAAKNALLLDYCDAINAARHQPDWFLMKQRSATETLRSQYNQDHTAVVTALRRRDADAARQALHRHLKRVSDHLLAIEI